jgi:hypothetical protein
MEWMLQVVDEFDDYVHALRHQLEGVGTEIGLLIKVVAAAAAIGLAVLAGANALVIAGAIGLLGGATLLKMQSLVGARR